MLRLVPAAPSACRCAGRTLLRSPRRAALVGAVAAAAAGGSAALAEGPTKENQEAAQQLDETILVARSSGVSIKELRPGDGALADEGSWATVHYTVRLVGDGTVLDDTRTSGFMDRDYGKPFAFTVGDLTNKYVLRALHPCVLDMRVGGVRRVRTNLTEPAFGYRKPPTLQEVHHGRLVDRELRGDWFIDVEVSLEALADAPPPGVFGRVLQGLRAAIGG